MSLKEKLKIMIVDDMTVSRGLLFQSLEEIGMKNILSSKSGEEALEVLTRSRAHLVISDYNMPGMSGLDLLEKLRRNSVTAKMGFMLVTGTPTPEVLERGRKLGLNNLVRKPFTSDSLKTSIEAVVGRL